jgi:hypothetical protein
MITVDNDLTIFKASRQSSLFTWVVKWVYAEFEPECFVLYGLNDWPSRCEWMIPNDSPQ